jgi:tetratricopeptide (TPR) repeat protein
MVALLAAAALAAAPLEAQFAQCRELFETHDDSGESMKDAEACFRKVLAANPRHAASIAYLGFIAAGRERRSEAESYYRRALDADANCAEARVGLANLSVRDGRHDEARALLREAAARSPKNRLALHTLAGVLTGESFRPTDEDWKEAMRCWRTLISLDRNDRDAHHLLAQAYRRFGQWSDAEREFREVLRIGQTKDDADVWVYSVNIDVAEMCEKQGKWREAARHWQAVIDFGHAGEEEIARARAALARLSERR